MKTAAEMRASNPTNVVNKVLLELEEHIEVINRNGGTETRFSAACDHPDRFTWVQEWVNSNDCSMIEAIIGELRIAGYRVTELYEEKQFVDIDIIISWA